MRSGSLRFRIGITSVGKSGVHRRRIGGERSGKPTAKLVVTTSASDPDRRVSPKILAAEDGASLAECAVWTAMRTISEQESEASARRCGRRTTSAGRMSKTWSLPISASGRKAAARPPWILSAGCRRTDLPGMGRRRLLLPLLRIYLPTLAERRECGTSFRGRSGPLSPSRCWRSSPASRWQRRWRWAGSRQSPPGERSVKAPQ